MSIFKKKKTEIHYSPFVSISPSASESAYGGVSPSVSASPSPENDYPYLGASGSPYLAPEPLDVSDEWIDKIWEKMYSRPVIVRCSHCNSHNVISNPTCIQCGAPMGDYKRMISYV